MALVVLAAGSGGARSEDSGYDPTVIDRMAESIHQVPLTEDMVDRLIASQPEMRSAAQKFSDTTLPESPPTKESAASDLEALPADKREALEAVAKKYGFSSLSEWSDVAASVTMSYAYALQGKKPGAVKEAVDQKIAGVEGDPDLTEAQRQETIARFRELETKLAALEPLQANYDLVLRMKDKVTSIMDPN
jgi:hypothetical protein